MEMTQEALYWLLLGFCAWNVAIIAFHIYFLPTLLAYRRDHVNRVPILVVNAVFGASALGWIIALVWSLTHATKPNLALGPVVRSFRGHRTKWDGWIPEFGYLLFGLALGFAGALGGVAIGGWVGYVLAGLTSYPLGTFPLVLLSDLFRRARLNFHQHGISVNSRVERTDQGNAGMIDDWWLIRFDSIDETWSIGTGSWGSLWINQFDNINDKYEYARARSPDESPEDNFSRRLKLLRRSQILSKLTLDEVHWISRFLREHKVPVEE